MPEKIIFRARAGARNAEGLFMRNFVLGIVFAIIVLLLVAIGLALLGFSAHSRQCSLPRRCEAHSP